MKNFQQEKQICKEAQVPREDSELKKKEK